MGYSLQLVQGDVIYFSLNQPSYLCWQEIYPKANGIATPELQQRSPAGLHFKQGPPEILLMETAEKIKQVNMLFSLLGDSEHQILLFNTFG